MAFNVLSNLTLLPLWDFMVVRSLSSLSTELSQDLMAA